MWEVLTCGGDEYSHVEGTSHQSKILHFLISILNSFSAISNYDET